MEERHCTAGWRGEAPCSVHGSIGSSDAKPETRALNQRARERHPPYQGQCARPAAALAAGAGAKRFESVLLPRALTAVLVASVFTRGFGRSVGRSMGRPSFGQRGDNTLSRILTHSVLRSRRVTRRPTVAGWQMASGDDRGDGGGGGGHATVIK